MQGVCLDQAELPNGVTRDVPSAKMTSPRGVHSAGTWILHVIYCRHRQFIEAPKLGATTTTNETCETEKGNCAWGWQGEEAFTELHW